MSCWAFQKKASEALLKYNEATGSREKKVMPESRRYRSSPAHIAQTACTVHGYELSSG